MFAEMTPGSNHTLARKGIERNCCVLYRQQKPRPEKNCHISGSRTKDQRHTRSPCLRNCLTFCFKDRARMAQREASGDSHVEGTEGRHKELCSMWFIDTQVPLIVHNGFFPTWFLGFITRQEAEEILREKELGCFLIRLSDKAIGYILSYKSRNRCRHFVINQSESGQFVVCGDTEGHHSVSDLIEYYKTSSIQPFGEYLTSSCFEGLNKELYDIIQVSSKEKPVGAVKNTRKPQVDLISEQPPARPPKSNRTLEEVPPLPRRSRHFDSGPLIDPERVLYAQFKKQSPREIPRFQPLCQENVDTPWRAGRSTTQDQNISRCSSPSRPESVYSELDLLETKSRSLPLLNNSSDGEQSYRLSAPPHTPPRLSPKPVRQATCCGPLPEGTDSSSRASSSHSQEYMSDSVVYHLAGRPGSPYTTSSGTRSSASEQHSNSVYAEVSNKATVVQFPHTYEQIAGHEDTDAPKPNSNTYEPLKDIRPKHNHCSWGLKNNTWQWLFPGSKRKW
ncbi:SH2 domain-containing protein 7-like [Cottoperca gobio]|uniref:SH2 domain-containing protein 7-like n=1 Tax=Cottoperca gobio TaxID=56716 RepID=A0A6J2PVS7_COTGO|nr:SH2 domain-containing protein 7-like [Cottoperca gobio]